MRSRIKSIVCSSAHRDHPRKRAQALVWCDGRLSVTAIANIAVDGWWMRDSAAMGSIILSAFRASFGKGSLDPWRKRLPPLLARSVNSRISGDRSSISPVRAPTGPVAVPRRGSSVSIAVVWLAVISPGRRGHGAPCRPRCH